MNLFGFILLLIIAAIAGSLGQAISGYSLGGWLISMLVGLIGAALGMWFAEQFRLPEPFVINVQDEAFPLVWALVGSAILTALLGLFSRGRRGRSRIST